MKKGWQKIANSSGKKKLWLGAAVIFGLWLIWPASGSRVKPAAEQILQLAAQIRQEFQSKPDFWGLSTDWVIKNQATPQGMLKKGQIINALGRPVLVGGGNDGQVLMPGSRSFNIIYPNLSFADCAKLAAYPFSEQQALGMLSLTIINGGQEYTYGWGAENSLPLGLKTAKSVCKGQNVLVWGFGN